MRIVTFNLRVEAKDDGINQFHLRYGFVMGKILTERPELLGFQECSDAMTAALRRGLDRDYLLVGNGREKDYHGETNCIALRRDCFALLTLDTFWLSPTPRVPGSRYANQSSCPRICTCVTVRCTADGQVLRVYNTHLDHISDEARCLGAEALLTRIQADRAEWPLPLLVTGDFNTAPDTLPVQRLCGEGELTDLTEGLGMSFHDYGRIPEDKGERIDYILGRDVRCLSRRRWEDSEWGMYLSDHYPLEAEFETIK